MQGTCCWCGILLFTSEKIEVLSVCCLFFYGAGSVCGCIVCMRTHTLVGYLDVSPGVGTRNLENQKNPDGLSLVIHIFVYVYKVHLCIYVLRGGMRPWTKSFFSLTYLLFR